MAKKFVFGLLMLASTAFIGHAAFAAEPTLNQVYQTAEAGKLSEAQTMMHEVLQVHPDSGKAHFVEADLLAKQGQLQKAEAELATAERLAPGLPFAKPQAVQNLKGLVGGTHTTRPADIQKTQPFQAPHESSFPWGMLFIGLGLIAFIVWAARFMSQRNAASSTGNYGPNANGFGNTPAPYGQPMQPYGANGVGPVGMPGQGLGSRVMGGLATGAAVGAGMVAGEALMHRFMGGNENSAHRAMPFDLGPSADDTFSNDLGGNDFGVTDSSSWDDSSGGSSDWN